MTDIVEYEWLYKRDSNGGVRQWRMERDGNLIRSRAGLTDGQHVLSGWKTITGSGIGKAKKTDEEQAEFNIKSSYENRLTRSYHSSVDNIDQPIKFDPMLAQTYKDWDSLKKFAKDRLIYSQPKLDGIRCIVTANGMVSRAGKPIKGAPHIMNALKSFFEDHPDAILDGELYNHDYSEDFNSIVSAVKQQKPTAEDLELSAKLVQYHIYDYPSEDLYFLDRVLSLVDHFKFLSEDSPIRIVETHLIQSEDAVIKWMGEYLESGYEGQMLRVNDVYENKRSKFLWKHKEFVDEEFEVVRILEGQGNWAGYAKAVECRMKDGRTFRAGIKGNQEFTKKLLNETHKVVTIKYFNLTPFSGENDEHGGKPRFGVAIKWWGEGRNGL